MLLRIIHSKIFKKARTDVSLTFGATVIAVGVLQILIYPSIAASVDAVEYGIFLTIIGIANILAPSFGATLRNSRIVLYEDYYAAAIEQGDFLVLLCAVLPVSLIGTIAMCLFVFQQSVLVSLLVGVTVCANVSIAYYEVVYRIPIDSKGYFKKSCFACLGYLIGIPIVFISKVWVMPFLLAALFSVAYICKTTQIIFEKPSITSFMGSAIKTYGYLVGSNLLSYASTYIDRFLLLPLLGAQSVSVYYVASFCGKALSFFTGPISTVLLSYICDGTIHMETKHYNLINLALLFAGVAAFLLLCLFAPIITRFLYATLYNQAYPFIIIGNAASLLMVLNGINCTVVLKIAPTYWQTILAAIRLILSASAALPLVFGGGLFEFCVTLLIINVLILLLTYFLGLFYVSKKAR